MTDGNQKDTTTTKVLISTSTFAEYDTAPLKTLQDAGLEIMGNPHRRKLKPDECIQLYTDIQGLIAGTEALTVEVLQAAKNLKVISRCGAGIDNVDVDAARELGIKVYATPDAPTQAVAELTTGLIIDLLRGISTEDRSIRSGTWPKHMGSLLAGKTLGVVGLGRIGKRIVELTGPFGLKYIAWDNSPDRKFASGYGINFTGLDELLGMADVITLHLPYTEELKGVIGERELGLMKESAFLLNTARGGLVNENALYHALREGRIAGAALDVFEREPYSGPLRELDNIILTSHIGSYARESRIDMEMQAVINLMTGLGYQEEALT